MRNIGTARLSQPNVGSGYAGILGEDSVSITGVDALEVNSGGYGIFCGYKSGGVSITDCGKVALYSQLCEAIENRNGDVTVEVGTLIAVTSNAGAIRAASYNTQETASASITATNGLYTKGTVKNSAAEPPTVKVGTSE